MRKAKALEEIKESEDPKSSKKRTKAQRFEEKADELFKKSNMLYQRMNSFLKNATGYLVEIRKENKDMIDFLESVKKTNENVDETLCEVLLAIRQNEYLQAWYPEKDPSNPFIAEA